MSAPTFTLPVALLFSDDDKASPSPLVTSFPHWCLQQDAQSRLLSIQLVWLDMTAEFARQEAEFIKLSALAGERLSRCGFSGGADQKPEQTVHCYHRAMNEFNDAAFTRLRRVSELSHDLREQIWDEI